MKNFFGIDKLRNVFEHFRNVSIKGLFNSNSVIIGGNGNRSNFIDPT